MGLLTPTSRSSLRRLPATLTLPPFTSSSLTPEPHDFLPSETHQRPAPPTDTWDETIVYPTSPLTPITPNVPLLAIKEEPQDISVGLTKTPPSRNNRKRERPGPSRVQPMRAAKRPRRGELTMKAEVQIVETVDFEDETDHRAAGKRRPRKPRKIKAEVDEDPLPSTPKPSTPKRKPRQKKPKVEVADPLLSDDSEEEVPLSQLYPIRKPKPVPQIKHEDVRLVLKIPARILAQHNESSNNKEPPKLAEPESISVVKPVSTQRRKSRKKRHSTDGKDVKAEPTEKLKIRIPGSSTRSNPVDVTESVSTKPVETPEYAIQQEPVTLNDKAPSPAIPPEIQRTDSGFFSDVQEISPSPSHGATNFVGATAWLNFGEPKSPDSAQEGSLPPRMRRHFTCESSGESISAPLPGPFGRSIFRSSFNYESLSGETMSKRPTLSSCDWGN